MTILAEGSVVYVGAGFSRRLLYNGANVLGVDNLHDHYGANPKKARPESLNTHSRVSARPNNDIAQIM